MDTMLTRRGVAGLLGALGLGAVGVPVPAAKPAAKPEVLPACSMRIHLIGGGRSVALTAHVVQTADGWELQGLFSDITGETVTVPLDPTGAGEFTQLLRAALASEEPDPELVRAKLLRMEAAYHARRAA